MKFLRYETLTIEEIQQLGQYNAERERGIVHTPEWDSRMAELQAQFDAERK